MYTEFHVVNGQHTSIRMIRLIGRSIAPLLIIAMIASCATEEPKQPPQPAPISTSSVPLTPAARPAPLPAVHADPLTDLKDILSKRSIFYDLDKYDVKPEFMSLVEAHAKYLREHPGATVKIEGNADERGSREYNIGLGQRRAEGIMNMMQLLGVPDRQLEAVSFGEEKPKAQGHDEASWAENRRSDIVYERTQ